MKGDSCCGKAAARPAVEPLALVCHLAPPVQPVQCIVTARRERRPTLATMSVMTKKGAGGFRTLPHAQFSHRSATLSRDETLVSPGAQYDAISSCDGRTLDRRVKFSTCGASGEGPELSGVRLTPPRAPDGRAFIYVAFSLFWCSRWDVRFGQYHCKLARPWYCTGAHGRRRQPDGCARQNIACDVDLR